MFLFVDSYVVKLFDRTVDVAPYSENAALYPLCRDWFRNNSSEQYIEQAPQAPTQVCQHDTTCHTLLSSCNGCVYLCVLDWW